MKSSYQRFTNSSSRAGGPQNSIKNDRFKTYKQHFIQMGTADFTTTSGKIYEENNISQRVLRS